MPGKVHFFCPKDQLHLDSFWTEKWDKIFKTPFYSILGQNTAKMP